MGKSGIYKIECLIDNKVYIGQSVDTKRRLGTHKSKLRSNKHDNTYLQNYINKYGMENFTFEIIEICELDELDSKETYWIAYYDSMDRSKGFNRESGGSLNKQYSKERIESITGKGNPMYGKKQSSEFIELIRICNRGSSDKLTEQNVEEIKTSLYSGVSQKELSEKFNVKLSTINKIAKCKNWEWVLPNLNKSLIEQSEKQKRIRDKEIINLHKSGFSNSHIGNKLKIDVSTVSRVLKNNGFLSKNNIIKKLTDNVITLHLQKLTNREIASILKINNKTVSKILKDHHYSSKSGNRKLNDDEVIEIKKMLQDGAKVTEIAKVFNIKRQTITDIKFNRTWKHIVLL
jgi:group I intron endonuclease